MAESRKALIIEDDRTDQVVLKAVVEKAGFQAVASLDAMQGVMPARQQQPAVVLLDLKMPAGGGGSVFERIQQMTGTMGVPVLVYSALPRAQAEKLVPPAPNVRFVPKPSPPDALLAALRELVPA